MTWSRYVEGERGPDLHVHRAHTDAVIAERRYEADDLVIVAQPDGIDVTVPGAAGGGLTFVPAA